MALMGAQIVQQCLQAGLLDVITTHLVGVLPGRGIQLRDHLSTQPVELEKIGIIDAPGVTHLQFRVKKQR